MRVGNKRAWGVAIAGMAVVTAGLSACAVPGAGSADPSEAAAYATQIEQSRESAAAASAAAAAETTRAQVCPSWNTARQDREEVSRATARFTDDPNWTWGGISPLLDRTYAAISTETTKMDASIKAAAPFPTLQTDLIDYKTKLDAYGTALRADQNARGSGDQTWPRTNPASDALVTSTSAARKTCGV